MLVVYYTWSNGNTERIAKMLAEATGADLMQIDTEKPYEGSYNEVVDQGQEEVNRGYEPKLKPLTKDIKDYDIENLRSQIGMVLQKNELFTGTILENLRWGKPDATLEEAEEACRVAQVHDFILTLAEGYQTILGRGGINLSGGQKQRLCIARALLRKPKILILDDSTSAVDSETELRIRNNLNCLLKDTTVLIITQRINTMQSADRVIVLEDGEVEAIGTPDELMATSRIYQEIYNSQQILN